jgi:DNA-binding NtrC family response regulator
VESRALDSAREQFERKYIQKALLRNAWDTIRTAAELKIDEAALGAKIKALGITFID